MAKVGELGQENVPWCVERGEGTFEQRWTFWVTISGGIRLMFRIPKGTEWLSDVLFGGGGFQSNGRGTRSLFLSQQLMQ